MKKIIALLLAVAMLATLGLSAFAAGGTITAQETDSDVIVQTSIYKDEDGTEAAENFTVTYPAVTTIYWGTVETEAEYTIDAQLQWDHRLSVTVAANSDVMTSENTSEELSYALSGDTEVETEEAVADSETNTLIFTVETEDWESVPVDVYADTLTFTVAVVNAD